MRLFLVYVATGDFYEEYDLEYISTDQHQANQFANEKYVELEKERGLNGYEGKLVFIREVESDKQLHLIFGEWGNIPKEWFVKGK